MEGTQEDCNDIAKRACRLEKSTTFSPAEVSTVLYLASKTPERVGIYSGLIGMLWTASRV
jgi:hypothetical protein